MEVILLMAGAVLITVIILSMLFSSVSLPGITLNENIDVYTQHVSVSGGFGGDSDDNPPILETCGNDSIDTGETCDPPTAVCVPPYESSCEYCADDCHLTTIVGGYCGNSITEGSEQCDDGNGMDGDGCSSACQIESDPPYCGDGSINQPSEECDDGNETSGDGCSAICEIETSPTYSFGAKFEPPDGKIFHGMGQWEGSSGNPVYVNLLTNTSQNPLASPSLYPGSKLLFVAIANDLRWPSFIANLPNTLTNLHAQDVIPHLDISLRDEKPLVIDPLNPLYGVDDEIADTNIWDARIIAMADAFASNGKPAFLRIGGEFSGPWNGYHPYDYPRAYRKIVHIFKTRGADNVAFIWCYEPAAPGDFMEFSPVLGYKWFPGNDVIDWYGLDVFGPADFTPGGFNYANSVAFMNASVAANKPMHLSETSVAYLDITPSEADGISDWSAWFVPFFTFIGNYPNIKAFHYINYDWQLSDYAVEGWKNADISDNAYISQKYLEEMTNPKYIGATSISTLNGFDDYP